MLDINEKAQSIYIRGAMLILSIALSINIRAQTDSELNLSHANGNVDLSIEKIDHIEVYGETGKGDTAYIYLKNGTIEKRFLKTKDDNLRFQQKYSNVLSKHEPSSEPVPSHYKLENGIPKDVAEFTMNDEYIWITRKNGQKEKYNLKDKTQKENFEKKYGKLVERKKE